ncbi:MULTISPECIES: hypothetical protein [unclassified Bacillus (in: firmicutes)]|uniref:hypothetical protein n=1 Tax=unclassified Bacillus (in: firmicutes) TaxID=185979 RepID=UPI001BE71D23|nr:MULTISPECIES: hypothetical protein [unclassified Bacillus (in: firmicutes)]MBT2614125.1 hypothetical protein [Bacillus sp. ISL-78]MBT2629364.1 hypothetical protein [Bacillus sp. ISL-101]
MIDMEFPVISSLEAGLSDLVGDKVFRWFVPQESSGDYPYIRVAELDNTDEDYRDNKAVASDIAIQVDLWTKSDPNIVQNRIDQVMKSLHFKRMGVASFYEENTGAMRKMIRYTSKVNLEEE